MIRKKTYPDKKKSITREQKKLVGIIGEGKTELSIIDNFKHLFPKIIFREVKHPHSAPLSLLKAANNYEKQLDSNDDYIIAIMGDIDEWKIEHLKKLEKWERQSDKHLLIINKPRIEFAILLLFEQGFNIKSSSDIDKRLKKFCAYYHNKYIRKPLNLQQIKDLELRSKIISQNTTDISLTTYYTNIHKLIGILLETLKE